MEDTSKYLIHATVTADGVVERSDVVGAIFGQTEGLLGDELDLRELRQSQKVGRIDVKITSIKGSSEGTLTIATSLDKVETATLAAALETISRVGPCRAELRITEIEDVRAAKRKAVVDRAKELLQTGFDDSVMSSEEILAEVREYVRVEDITTYEDLPAGPRVADSDAIIIVEGRSDVLTLLKYGIKNAIAVEGTNVPDAVAELTNHRTVTAFLDGDRGGDLIFEELSQVGDIDYVAFAPSGESVEDLDHHQLFAALRNKVPYESVAEMSTPRDVVAATDGSTTPAPPITDSAVRDGREDSSRSDLTDDTSPSESSPLPTDSSSESARPPASLTGTSTDTDTSPSHRPTAESTHQSPAPTPGERSETDRQPSEFADEDESGTEGTGASTAPESIYDHVNAVIRDGSDTVRFLDDADDALDEGDVSDAYDSLESLESVPRTIVLDSILSQQLLDLAADRGVERIIARSLGQFTKRPAGVRVYAAQDVAERDPGSG